jgi:hypothetical protein
MTHRILSLTTSWIDIRCRRWFYYVVEWIETHAMPCCNPRVIVSSITLTTSAAAHQNYRWLFSIDAFLSRGYCFDDVVWLIESFAASIIYDWFRRKTTAFAVEYHQPNTQSMIHFVQHQLYCLYVATGDDSICVECA